MAAARKRKPTLTNLNQDRLNNNLSAGITLTVEKDGQPATHAGTVAITLIGAGDMNLAEMKAEIKAVLLDAANAI